MHLGDEEIVVTIFLGTVLILFFAVIIVFLFVIFNNKNKLNIKDREITKKVFERTLLQSQLEIKEQTLRHIAHELHDNFGQVASLIKINLTTLPFDDPVTAKQKIEDTKELIRQLILDLKSLSLSLNSDRVVQLGIVKGLENEVERINKTGQFTATLQASGIIPTLDANTTIILYRMAQEILNNIVKHSEAKQITIILDGSEKMFTLVCCDDGVGFDREEKEGSGGSGLLNLKSRAKLIQANLTIQSSPGKGTSVSVELPI